jgi:predicted Zn-ribbon and HTH transcriptional regulator
MADKEKPETDLSNTLHYMRCKKCGDVFVTNISGYAQCPDCSSTEAVRFQPGETQDC